MPPPSLQGEDVVRPNFNERSIVALGFAALNGAVQIRSQMLFGPQSGPLDTGVEQLWRNQSSRSSTVAGERMALEIAIASYNEK
jgi:hypothetical protein